MYSPRELNQNIRKNIQFLKNRISIREKGKKLGIKKFINHGLCDGLLYPIVEDNNKYIRCMSVKKFQEIMKGLNFNFRDFPADMGKLS